MIELAIRLDTTKIDAPAHIKKINKYATPSKYLWSFELGKKTEKPHIHGYLVVSKDLETVRKWFQRNYKSLHSCCLVQNTDKYKDYTVKDLNILSTNLSEDEMDDLIERAQDIAEDKKLSKVDKLLNYVREKEGIVFSEDYEEYKTPDDETIVNHIVDWHLDRHLLFNHNQILSYFNNVKGRLTLEGRKEVKRSVWLYINKYNS